MEVQRNHNPIAACTCNQGTLGHEVGLPVQLYGTFRKLGVSITRTIVLWGRYSGAPI